MMIDRLIAFAGWWLFRLVVTCFWLVVVIMLGWVFDYFNRLLWFVISFVVRFYLIWLLGVGFSSYCWCFGVRLDLCCLVMICLGICG